MKDLTGEKFGRLTVLVLEGKNEWGTPTWRCICSCGEIKIISSSNLNKRSQSCGCFRREAIAERNKTHGATVGGKPTPEHETWHSMIQRCHNANHDNFHSYGGRGITVCDRWRQSFSNFLNDVGKRPTGKTLDRYPDKNGNYEPGNVRWATPKEQAHNRNTNKIIHAFNKSQPLQAWADEYLIPRDTLSNRIKSGIPIEDALTRPIKKTCPRRSAPTIP